MGVPFSIDGLRWQRLRLRDGQAGKQFAILRDERTLRSALLGIGDGRQVAVQVLANDEELGEDDMILLLRPWRVAEGRLHAPTEMVVQKSQTLASFQEQLTARYRGLLGKSTEATTDKAAESGEADTCADTTVTDTDCAESAADDDWLELCVVPTAGPPLN